MAYGSRRTEHSGPKKGTGAYWGRKRFAKHESNRKRRMDGKAMADEGVSIEINNYGYHEALDRTWIILDSLESILGEHPVIKQEPEAKELYDKAVDNLATLYVRLGEIIADK